MSHHPHPPSELAAKLMARDDFTRDEAEAEIAACREAILSGEYESPETAMEKLLGLEPHYLFDVIRPPLAQHAWKNSRGGVA